MMMISVLLPHQMQAASGIRIYIDGTLLPTDQEPVIVNGRTLVPLRSIFEALNASVNWDQQTQTVTAYKRETKIVLKIGDRSATINDRTTVLDTPAQIMNGRTLVPVRFVSESLGEEVMWDPKTQTVSITTSQAKQVEAVSNLSVMLAYQYSDGRDVSIQFAPVPDQTQVRQYRILVVKADNASSFNLSKAKNVTSANYTTVSVNDAYRRATLTSQTKDVDGSLLRANQSYRVFVLTVGNDSHALSNASAPFSITGSLAADPVANVSITDVGDFGDGRDLLVGFAKPSDESNISGYRVMIVKTKDAALFNLTAANAVTSDYYTTVSKSGSSTLNAQLTSSSRDTSGERITNGVAYTAFVLSVSNHAVASLNRLSAGSPSVTLASSVSTPVIFSVADVGNHGDGRDLSISFLRAPDESRISGYRIFVVRSADTASFSLTEAAKVASGRYYDISKTGSGIVSLTLPSTMKDVKGNAVKNGVSYRIFVMGVSNHSNHPHALSAPSSSITLSSENTISSVTHLSVSDVGDFNNGLDLRVSFRKPANESNIHHYRIFVVRDANASNFHLATANAITDPAFYTTVNKTGKDLSVELPPSARDVNGAFIQNGVKYRVFVLSVGDGVYWGTNVLSSASPEITLTNQTTIAAVKNVRAVVKGTNGDASDIEVNFSMSETEFAIKDYRVLVVPARSANTFVLADANRAVTNGNDMMIQKLGRDISQRLNAALTDSEGNALRSGERYRVFVLATASGGAANALSGPSDEITIATRVVPAPEVQNVTAQQGSGAMNLVVSFTNANDSGIAHYAVLLVRETDGNLTENMANSYYSSGNFTKVGRAERSVVLTGASTDVSGAPMAYHTPYRVYVLSIADGTNATVNKLSTSVANVILREV